MADPCCGNCRFCRTVDNKSVCARHAPTPWPGSPNVWQPVQKGYWCGDYEEKGWQDERGRAAEVKQSGDWPSNGCT